MAERVQANQIAAITGLSVRGVQETGIAGTHSIRR